MFAEFTVSNTSKRNQHLSLLLLDFQNNLGSLLLISSCIQLSYVSVTAKYTNFATFFKWIYCLYVKVMVVGKEYVLSVLSTSV